MDTFHGDDGRSNFMWINHATDFILLIHKSEMHCFDSDEDNLEYLASLMSEDENDDIREDIPLQCVEKPKSRIESTVFDEELDTVAKSRKRKLSQETQVRKKSCKEQTQKAKDDHTASLEGECYYFRMC